MITPSALRPGDSTLREEVRPQDESAVRTLVAATGFFRDDEVAIAGELVQERLARGPATGYEFVFIDHQDRLLGYACYGLVPCSTVSWDLYWIAVDPDLQGAGIGGRLLATVEDRIRARGGVALYAETSGRPLYRLTRAFYRRQGFAEGAVFADFYALDDDKVVFVKRLDG
jgi:ribosomal protein S18 acetylase RimI-like enzyme